MKKISSIIGLLVVIGISTVLVFNQKNIFSSNVATAPIIESGPQKIKINPNIINITLPLSNDPKDVAWALFQKYLQFNKDQNLEGVKSVVYKISSVCNDPKDTIDCKARMGNAYKYGSALKKEDFVNVWSDEKQIILSTDFKSQEDDYTASRARSIIFFIKDETGNQPAGETSLKMLSFSPFKGATTPKGTASEQEVKDRLIIYTEDTDQDGIADYIEQCIPADTKDTCIPTNPKIRDTYGDGYWDGIRALMK